MNIKQPFGLTPIWESAEQHGNCQNTTNSPGDLGKMLGLDTQNIIIAGGRRGGGNTMDQPIVDRGEILQRFTDSLILKYVESSIGHLTPSGM